MTSNTASKNKTTKKDVSNDNVAGYLTTSGLDAATKTPVNFAGSRSLLAPAIALGVLTTIAIAVGIYVKGLEGFAPTQTFRLLVIGGYGIAFLLLVHGFLKKQTTGLHSMGRVVRLSKGFPNFKLTELPADSIVSVDSKRGFVGQMAKSGTLSIVNEEGRRFVLRGLQNSEGAHALLSLQVAAAKAYKDQERLRLLEKQRWTDATTPVVVSKRSRPEIIKTGSAG